MQFQTPGSEFFVPDGIDPAEALGRTTYMGIAAHQDDLEIMSWQGILECFQNDEKWFAGVVMSNGSGSPRSDLYADYSDEKMMEVRAKEQKKAAHVGEFGSLSLLHHASDALKNPAIQGPIEELVRLLEVAGPRRVYTHNLADKHDTHVAVALSVLEACRRLPAAKRPREVWGCEVWRDLDWMRDEDKLVLDCSGHENLQAALLGVFDSQVCGGKRYDLATMGRRHAHATYHESHAVDVFELVTFAMDLSPLVEDPELEVRSFVRRLLDRFHDDVRDRVARLLG